jgi:hypothetical protein
MLLEVYDLLDTYSEVCLRRVWKVQRLLVVDDFHAASLPGRESVSIIAANSPNWTT